MTCDGQSLSLREGLEALNVCIESLSGVAREAGVPVAMEWEPKQ